MTFFLIARRCLRMLSRKYDAYRPIYPYSLFFVLPIFQKSSIEYDKKKHIARGSSLVTILY
jgi:hypothetical protein